MSARPVPAASVTIGILGSGLDEDGIVQHPETRTAILGVVLRALQRHHAAATSLGVLHREDRGTE
jgi:hypothetical protein